jgi:predicted PurR-regulated permease PerM
MALVHPSPNKNTSVSTSSTSCLFLSPPLNETLKVFMQVFFVVAFLSLFFFLYVVKVEKEIFTSQINIIVDTLFDELQNDMSIILPSKLQTILKQEVLDYMNSVTIDSESYDNIRQQNDNVITTTKNLVFVFATILGACLFSIYMLRFCVDMSHHLIENILALTAIAITEFLFLNLVSKKYIAANPNHIKLYFAQRVKYYAQQKLNSQF